MPIIADLHLHSKYSRAVSQKMDLWEIAHFASLKGIDLVATGDWTHPFWLREIKNNLKEIAPGIFTLINPSPKQKRPVNFILSTEIASIYNQNGKTRRIHNLIFSPSLSSAEKIIADLRNHGANLNADGRPIIGLSSRDLLELILEINPSSLLIPAHIWTPWFSLFGSKSGFSSIDECFGDLSNFIFAIETGLSSDPMMNWQIKDLQKRAILSFSDAHSGQKLGREATVFVENNDSTISNSSYSFFDISDAIKQKPNGKLKIGYTIEFFPEEGKYHWSGHRNCNIRYSPEEVIQKGPICPICHQPLTIGVENQIIAMSQLPLKKEDLLLSKNKNQVTFVGDPHKKHRPFVSLVPLLEILVEINQGSQTKGLHQYEEILKHKSEFDLLLKTPLEEIAKIGGEKLRQAIKIVRNREVFVDPGYDGVFGKVKIFPPENNNNEKTTKEEKQQLNLF